MLKIFKGYEKEQLEKIKDKALIKNDIEEKYDIKDYKILAEQIVQEVALKLVQLKNDELWITYEEFSVCHETLVSLAKTLNIEIQIIDNNKYYSAYPFQGANTKLIEEIYNRQNDICDGNEEDIIYAYVYIVNKIFFIQYHNYEYDYADYIKIENRYKENTEILQKSDRSEFVFDINEDIENYIGNIIQIEKYNSISISLSMDTNITREIKRNLVSYIKSENKQVFEYEEKNVREQKREEFIRIAKDVIGIPNFVDFKNLNFYKNPLEGNEIIQISQENIINEITCQIDKAKQLEENKYYRDIFITAPTGAGKSVMFQIPAIYAAEKYQSISIVISPLVELMNDQVENLQKRGYCRAARINSDINAVEREEIIKKIEEKEIDIVYISPEALLSYSIESIIGTRDISTIIIDEAHIVTTWGQGFRPDYWYLGTYIERLRKSRYKKGALDIKSKIYDFPVCTFTATSVFGGEDDGVSEISKSLYLIDPIKFIGEVKRKDIKFDINVIEDKLSKSETEEHKSIDLERRIKQWDKDKEKSLVYFPYNSLATEAYNAVGNFDNLKEMKEKIGIYTGQVDKSLKKYEAELYKKRSKKYHVCY